MPTTDRPPNFAVPERSELPSTVAAIGRPRVPYAETGVTSTRTVSPAGTIEPASVANDPPLARASESGMLNPCASTRRTTGRDASAPVNFTS